MERRYDMAVAVSVGMSGDKNAWANLRPRPVKSGPGTIEFDDSEADEAMRLFQGLPPEP